MNNQTLPKLFSIDPAQHKKTIEQLYKIIGNLCVPLPISIHVWESLPFIKKLCNTNKPITASDYTAVLQFFKNLQHILCDLKRDAHQIYVTKKFIRQAKQLFIASVTQLSTTQGGAA